MLVPLLASPFQDLLMNYYVQDWLSALGLFASGFLLAQGCGNAPDHGWGWLTLLVLLLSWNDEAIWSLTSIQLPFGASAALLGWVCVLARRGYSLGLFFAALLCFWVNSALFPIAMVLVAPGRRRYLPLILAFLAMGICTRTSPYYEARVEWIRLPSFAAVGQGTQQLVQSGAWTLLPLALGLAHFPSASSLRLLAAAGVALAEFFLLGWVEANQFHIRYVSIGLLLLSAALAEPLARRLSDRPRTVAVLAAMAIALLLVRFRPESPAGLLDYWVQQSGDRVRLARDWNATFIGAEFESSWKVAFLSRLLPGARVDALAARSRALRSELSPLLARGALVLTDADDWLELQVQASSLGVEPTAVAWTTIRRSEGTLLCALRVQQEPPPLESAEVCPVDQWLSSSACWPYLGHGFNQRDGGRIATIGRSAEICLKLPQPSQRLLLEFSSRDSEQQQELVVQLGGRSWNSELTPGGTTQVGISLKGVPPGIPLRLRLEIPRARRMGKDWPLFALNLEGFRVDSQR